jgi:hypothetical protein
VIAMSNNVIQFSDRAAAAKLAKEKAPPFEERSLAEYHAAKAVFARV